ncbi:MAG TPA: hypothetical protein VGJ84_21505 [Polyangiaceae bacterium]
MKGRGLLVALLLGLGLTRPALAQKAEGFEARAQRPRLGMSPGAPQNQSAAPAQPYGIESTRADDWVLNFHGYVQAPLSLGFAERVNPVPGQSSLVIHSPPDIPQDIRSFEFTGVIPKPWVQLDFTYGTTLIRGNLIIAARQISSAGGVYIPPDNLGLSDAWVSFDLTPVLGQQYAVEANVGGFKSRYGIMGEYDQGRYGTPVIARINSIGENLNAALDLESISLVLEQGFGASVGTPSGAIAAGWNDFADRNSGATLVTHVHAGVAYDLSREPTAPVTIQGGLHYITAFSQDDRVAGNLQPDGKINVYGADVRLTAGPFGHLYVGLGRAELFNAKIVSGAIEILNARGGAEITREYLDGKNQLSNGNGALTTLGGQYELSVRRLMFPELKDHGPDIYAAVFGMRTAVESFDPELDGTLKWKAGAELTYSMFSWLGMGARYDHVTPNDAFPDRNFDIISPRVIFHTDWNSPDELVLQYSRFIYGTTVIVKSGFPPEPDPTIHPDQDVLTMSASVWW